MTHNLVIFGPPGAGKGTQSAAIRERLGVFHLSTGDMLREAIKNETETGKLAKQYTDAGKLVPDEVVIKIVEEKVAGTAGTQGVLFDGFPRTLDQAKALDGLLGRNGRAVTMCISVDVPDEDIVNRLTGRRMCPACNIIYHVKSKPPKTEGKCDSCGGDLIIRKDDNEEVIRQRLDAYHAQTSPVMDYYKEKGLSKIVDGTKAPDDVTSEIMKLF